MNKETRFIRDGEGLDAARLKDYLSAQNVGGGDISIEQFSAGSSNLTYLIKLGGDEFVLRRPPHGNTVRSAHDMRREFDVLSKLSAVYRPAPKPILYCGDASVIDSEFFLMERRRGLIIRGHQTQPASIAAGEFSISAAEPMARTADSRTALQSSVCQSFIKNLADLHNLDYKAAGLAELGRPEGYCRRQVEGWTKRYRASQTHDHAEIDIVVGWLNDRIPPESGAALVHNDYKFDNVMLDPADLTKITAVLDWEMATIGDPLLDLGTTLGYWISREAGEEMLNMPFNPRVLMEKITRGELAEMYAAASGRDVSNILYYYVFGTFKIAVIAQQIYARFVKGFTRDERFAHFDKFVSALGRIALRAVRSGEI